MNRAWAFATRKRYESLLAIVVGIFLVVQRVHSSFAYLSWFLLLVVLYIYDLKIISDSLQKVLSLSKRFYLELILLLVLVISLALWGFPAMSASLLSLGYLALVLSLHENYLKQSIRKGIEDIRYQPLFGLLIVVGAILFFIWNSNVLSLLFLVVFFAFLFYQWDSRIIAACALVSLSACPFLLFLHQDAFAEIAAEYAYFFLVMPVKNVTLDSDEQITFFHDP